MSEPVHIVVANSTPTPIRWEITDGDTVVASGALDANPDTLGSAAEVRPGVLTGGFGLTPNGLIVVVKPK